MLDPVHYPNSSPSLGSIQADLRPKESSLLGEVWQELLQQVVTHTIRAA